MTELLPLDPEYKNLIQQLKETVVSARMRAMLSVNAEQIQLYWEIGNTILERQKTAKWGSKLLEQISADLRESFPKMKGWSIRNLERMRQFASTYSGSEFPAQAVPQLPWSHIILLIQKVKLEVTRAWYANQAMEQGWSRDTLTQFIQSNLYERQGMSAHKLTNFQARLPAAQSTLAEAFIQDPIDHPCQRKRKNVISS